MDQIKYKRPSWDDVLTAYQDMVYHLALSMTKNTADADDVFQEVFLRLVRKDPVFHSEEHLKAWLIRTTINCSNSLWSSSWKKQIVSLNDWEEKAEDTFDGEYGLLDQVNALPKKYKAIIHLFYYEDLSLQTISEMLGIGYDAASKRLSRARLALKKKMKGDCSYAEFSKGISG